MSADYSIDYRKIFTDLGFELTSSDSISAEQIAEVEARLNVQLPVALRDYYLISGSLDQINQAHNRLYSPEGLFIDEGKLVFLEENQMVVFWGVDTADANKHDPAVYQGINLDDGSIEWHHEHDHCSEFLLVMLYWQAVCGGLEFSGMTDISIDLLPQLISVLPQAGQCQELRAYGKPGYAACALVDEDDGEVQLYVACRSQLALDQIRAELSQVGISIDQM